MGRIFVTGDKHSDFKSPDDYKKVEEFCKEHKTTKEDFMIVLGDHGINYFADWRDIHAKKKLAKMPIRFIMLRGNHDRRIPYTWKRTFIETDTLRGWFFEDRDYPDILYTEEYGWYEFGGKRTFVISGAYSVDKWYRLEMRDKGYNDFKWFSEEQLSPVERTDAEILLHREMQGKPFCIMSHTCPMTFKPIDNLLPGVNQDTVDETMELWLMDLYNSIVKDNAPLDKWYCGHWHIDRIDPPVQFMYHDIIQLG